MSLLWYSGGGLNAGLTFALPLNDLGAGVVNTAVTSCGGSGAPTFTRASVKWTKLSTGLWAQVASGTAASCYLGADTTVGAYGGYFAEAAGTQLVTPTASIRSMNDASWVKSGITAATTATGIDGVANSASTITASTNNGTILQTLTAAASSRTFSAFVRRKTGSGTVSITQTGGTSLTDITALINSTTYTRVSLTDSVLNAAFGFKIAVSGDALEVDFNQFEASAFATSPMASAGAARNADSLSYGTTSNIIGTIGSCYAEGCINFQTSGTHQTLVNCSTSARYPLYINYLNSKVGVYDGTTQVDGPAISTGVVFKGASRWSGSLMTAYANGVAGTAGAFDGDMDVTALTIGNDGVGGAHAPLNGMVKNIRIYSIALSDSQLQAMTT